MKAKPDHLQPQYGAQFQDVSVVSAYQYRPPVPDEVITVIGQLMRAHQPARILDIGCGRGELARRLAPHAEQVDAVDWSDAMVEAGRQLPSGDAPNLRWMTGKAEEVPLDPPYTLAIAGNSLHWMDWPVMLPRIAGVLLPDAVLAIVEWDVVPPAWQTPLAALIRSFSTNRRYQPYNLIEELASRGLFVECGRHQTSPIEFRQPVDHYIESFHARNGLSRDRLTKSAGLEFDQRLHALVAPHEDRGHLSLLVVGHVVWGRPIS